MAEQYKLLGGTYHDGKCFYRFERVRDTIVVSDRELDREFPNQFRRVGGPGLTTSAPPDTEAFGRPAPTIDGNTPALQPVPDAGLGNEVTNDHPKAQAAGLRVFRRDGRLVVTTAVDPKTPVHTQAGFATAGQVVKCVEKYLSQQAG